METILWFSIFLSNLLAGILALYFYLLHDDFNKNKITAYELTDTLSKYIPFEIFFQLLVTALSAYNNQYYLFLCYTPLALYNIYVLITKKYRVYGFSASEYRQQSPQLQSQMKYKSILYVLFCLSIGISFTRAFTRMAIYRIDVIVDSLISSE